LITIDNRVIFDENINRHRERNMISADLGKQLESYIQQLVEVGRYGSKSEVLREGVRLIQDRETKLAALDTLIMRGLADADTGRTKPASDVFDRLEAKYRVIAEQMGQPA
jgi:antitoxin ParD1/3/4